MDRKKHNIEIKNRKIVIFGVLIALFVVVVAIILAKTSFYEDISDEYFISDETKLVLSLNKVMAAFETGEYEPDVTRLVYEYRGDRIVGMRVFYDYGTEEEAKIAYDFVNLDNKDWATGKKLNGKYIIFSVDGSQYNKLTTDEVKENIERVRAVGGTADE